MHYYPSPQEEVLLTLKRISSGYTKPIDPRYYNSSFPLLGSIPVPRQRGLIKGYSFSQKTLEEQSEIWVKIWQEAEYFEVLSQPLFFFSERRHKLTPDVWDRLKQFSGRVDNWVHSDLLSGLYAQFLESYPDEVYPQLVEWNRSERPWERRLSIVSLFYYASQRKRKISYELAAPLIITLINDEHFYVQKGVGWAMRELYNTYPEQGLELIRRYASQIPPAGWYAATEKLSTDEKGVLKELRVAARRGNRGVVL